MALSSLRLQLRFLLPLMATLVLAATLALSLIHISEPTRPY